LPRGFSFAKRVRGQPFLCHCVRLFFAPRVFFCQAGARPLVACSPPLAALRDSLDRDPAARPVPGPLGVRKRRRHRHPVVVRTLGPRGRGRHGRWHPPGGLNAPLPQSGWTKPYGRVPGLATRLKQVGARGRVVVNSTPRADGAMTPERAGTERAPRSGVSLARFQANSEGPHRGTSQLGRTRRRVGGLRSMRSPSDLAPSPRGKKKPHAVKQKNGSRTRLAKKNPARSAISSSPVAPEKQTRRAVVRKSLLQARGANKGSRSEKETSCQGRRRRGCQERRRARVSLTMTLPSPGGISRTTGSEAQRASASSLRKNASPSRPYPGGACRSRREPSSTRVSLPWSRCGTSLPQRSESSPRTRSQPSPRRS